MGALWVMDQALTTKVPTCDDGLCSGAGGSGSCGNPQGDPHMACTGSGACSSSGRNTECNSTGIAQRPERNAAAGMCGKCKANGSRACVRQNEGLCSECLINDMQAKFRYAVKSKQVIRPGDRVLVPITGDFLSFAALDLLLVHYNPDSNRLQRGLVHFHVEVVWVDEGCLNPGRTAEEAACTEEMVRQSVEDVVNLSGTKGVEFSRLGLEDVFRSSSGTVQERQEKLSNLIGGIADATGREDLISHLSRRMVISHAKSRIFNKIVLSESKTSLGVHIIGSTAKAQGYGLPGDLHYIDARLGCDKPVIVRPLRDLTNKELGLYCHYRGIVTCTAGHGRDIEREQRSLNDAAESFILGLQNAFPSGLSSILRTGSKLQAFEWNSTPSAASKDEQIDAPLLCRICLAPVSCFSHCEKDVDQLDEFWKENFCFSCCSQIVLKFQQTVQPDSESASLENLQVMLGELCTT